MLENIKKYWFLYGVLAGAAVWIATINSKTFDSPEQKVEVTKFVEFAPTPEQQQRAIILDSINNAHAIKSRSKRDSLLREMVKRVKQIDSINVLNADQVYQIKEQLKANN